MVRGEYFYNVQLKNIIEGTRGKALNSRGNWPGTGESYSGLKTNDCLIAKCGGREGECLLLGKGGD